MSRAKPLLPLPPAARLGIAIHKLLEAAGKGNIECVAPEDAEAKLRSIIEETEQSMRQSWLDAHLVPLRRRVGSYEVRVIRAATLASTISRSLARQSRIGETRMTEDSFEVWVESSDGRIGGFIDRVTRDASGVTIVDYKTGSLSNPESSTATSKIKPEYEVQVQLYAALFAATFGEWPTRIRLLPLAGPPVEVKFTKDGCQRLVEEAVSLLTATQREIETLGGQERELLEALANPEADSCRSCLFRPGCPSYMSQVPRTTDGENWPIDVNGRVTDIRLQADGRIGLTLQSESQSGPTLRVRGLSGEPSRHPALQSLSLGDRISLFNLTHRGSISMLAEGPMTIAYRVPEDLT